MVASGLNTHSDPLRPIPAAVQAALASAVPGKCIHVELIEQFYDGGTPLPTSAPALFEGWDVPADDVRPAAVAPTAPVRAANGAVDAAAAAGSAPGTSQEHEPAVYLSLCLDNAWRAHLADAHTAGLATASLLQPGGNVAPSLASFLRGGAASGKRLLQSAFCAATERVRSLLRVSPPPRPSAVPVDADALLPLPEAAGNEFLTDVRNVLQRSFAALNSPPPLGEFLLNALAEATALLIPGAPAIPLVSTGAAAGAAAAGAAASIASAPPEALARAWAPLVATQLYCSPRAPAAAASEAASRGGAGGSGVQGGRVPFNAGPSPPKPFKVLTLGSRPMYSVPVNPRDHVDRHQIFAVIREPPGGSDALLPPSPARYRGGGVTLLYRGRGSTDHHCSLTCSDVSCPSRSAGRACEEGRAVFNAGRAAEGDTSDEGAVPRDGPKQFTVDFPPQSRIPRRNFAIERAQAQADIPRYTLPKGVRYHTGALAAIPATIDPTPCVCDACDCPDAAPKDHSAFCRLACPACNSPWGGLHDAGAIRVFTTNGYSLPDPETAAAAAGGSSSAGAAVGHADEAGGAGAEAISGDGAVLQHRLRRLRCSNEACGTWLDAEGLREGLIILRTGKDALLAVTEGLANDLVNKVCTSGVSFAAYADNLNDATAGPYPHLIRRMPGLDITRQELAVVFRSFTADLLPESIRSMPFCCDKCPKAGPVAVGFDGTMKAPPRQLARISEILRARVDGVKQHGATWDVLSYLGGGSGLKEFQTLLLTWLGPWKERHGHMDRSRACQGEQGAGSDDGGAGAVRTASAAAPAGVETAAGGLRGAGAQARGAAASPRRGVSSAKYAGLENQKAFGRLLQLAEQHAKKNERIKALLPILQLFAASSNPADRLRCPAPWTHLLFPIAAKSACFVAREPLEMAKLLRALDPGPIAAPAAAVAADAAGTGAAAAAGAAGAGAAGARALGGARAAGTGAAAAACVDGAGAAGARAVGGACAAGAAAACPGGVGGAGAAGTSHPGVTQQSVHELSAVLWRLAPFLYDFGEAFPGGRFPHAVHHLLQQLIQMAESPRLRQACYTVDGKAGGPVMLDQLPEHLRRDVEAAGTTRPVSRAEDAGAGCSSTPELRRARAAKIAYAADAGGAGGGGGCCKHTGRSGRHLPGILIAVCPHGHVLGYVFMADSESPRSVFDFLMDRFGPGCRWAMPQYILYDNACNLHHFCMLREPGLFHRVAFFIDALHERNHHHCSPMYSSTLYRQRRGLEDSFNTQGMEQVNSVLSRRVASQLAFMRLDRAVNFMDVFFGFYNMKKAKAATQVAGGVKAFFSRRARRLEAARAAGRSAAAVGAGSAAGVAAVGAEQGDREEAVAALAALVAHVELYEGDDEDDEGSGVESSEDELDGGAAVEVGTADA